MDRKFLITGAVFGLLAVILGAFAAHGLKNSLSPAALGSFETGVRFQMYHAFLLLILGNIRMEKRNKTIYILIGLGTILFSGSIYLLTLAPLLGLDLTSIALVTPLGGTLLIVGWILLVLNFTKLKMK
ncbi:DUF423 domain-containing protein [Christiangramia aquimixticola]|uniref:DUF423 domain-containing protein n=1 Tax=Christiangramia aquimixticola TaxID=1697558 RepID=UPI003AA9B9AC